MHKRKRQYDTQKDLIERFDEDVRRRIDSLEEFRDIDVIVGIPFHTEEETLPGVVRTACAGLEMMDLADRSLVLCVGPDEGEAALENAIESGGRDSTVPVRGFLLERGIEGRSLTTCAVMRAAARFKVPVVLLTPDLIAQPDDAGRDGSGFSPHWIPRLLEPVRDQSQDVVLAHFIHSPLDHPVEALLTYPFIAGIFGLQIRQPTPGTFALSTDVIQMCIGGTDIHTSETGIYGLDTWLIIHAISGGMNICTVPLGISARAHPLDNLEPVFRQMTHALFHEAVLHARDWLERPAIITTPRQAGAAIELVPPPSEIADEAIFGMLKKEYSRMKDTLMQELVPDRFRERIEQIVKRPRSSRKLDSGEWLEIVRGFLLMYAFEERYHPSDIVSGLFPFFLARLAGIKEEITGLQTGLAGSRRLSPESQESILHRESLRLLDEQAERCIAAWPALREEWYRRESETTSYLPRLGSWEFVPNVGVIVPQEIEKQDGGSVWANQIYQELLDRYRGEFMEFMQQALGCDTTTDSAEILARVKNFMLELDRTLRDKVFPYRLRTFQSANEMTLRIFEEFAREDEEGRSGPKMSWQLTPDAAENILKTMPPNNLIMQLGYRNVGELLEEMSPCDALAKAALTDYRQYLERVLDFIEKNGTIDWFHLAPIRPVVTRLKYVSVETELGGTEGLGYLTGRVLTSRIPVGWGGEFPRVWFFLNALQNIVGIEQFSSMLDSLLTRERDCGERIVTFMRGYWGRHPLSAFHAFEHKQQRLVVERIRAFAQRLAAQEPARREAARLLETAANVYNLSITLPDATFVPLSAWTWAQYSYRGGLGAPTSLSSTVERDWASFDFLTTYVERSGWGTRKSIELLVEELVRDGRASENLRLHLLGVSADPDSLMIAQSATTSSRPAGKLVRLSDKPILEPIADHHWESQYVLNAAAVRLDGTIYILYRAFGRDKISRIGLAWTRDGVHIDGRLDHPLFDVGHPSESAGCEDPRITVIGDTVYMLYTAWDTKIPQIAMASIPVQAFLEHRFDQWTRDGLGFPGLTNKDAVLYPETFNGRYVVYHRIDPNMWISYLENLSCPWPRTGQKIVVGPRPGMMWDGVKIGAGAPPIKTRYGWLNIYHGVDYQRSYRLGVLLMAPDDPAEIIYQSPNPILEPEVDYELGDAEGRDYWVPHVVFTCGAVPAKDKDVLDLDDEILVYYGAADTVIGVARGTLRHLVPILKEQI